MPCVLRALDQPSEADQLTATYAKGADVLVSEMAVDSPYHSLDRLKHIDTGVNVYNIGHS